ncbi:hypothetical protein ACFSHT_08990 [Paraburkholderia silviterrae]|uniref:Uncharacterized protein n=1 Tax=Paraburkholderia silviterrae TaxID=2528715 RepID=A0A4R5MDG7_9BURK|nr:hypothetical protein [Paraburkholderia silviterrae]TDG25128.1 hypothetical protein EYW47_04500 [Paraburkholderia silviterrae]
MGCTVDVQPHAFLCFTPDEITMPFSNSMLRQLAPWLPEQEDAYATHEETVPDDVIDDADELARAPQPIQQAENCSLPERDRIESLSLLSLKTSRFEERVDGNPTKGEGWEAVASALAHMPTDTADLARAMYLLDADGLRHTRDRLYALSGFRGGPIEHLGLSLVTATLQAFAAPRPCAHCHGAGRLLTGSHDVLDGDTGEWLRLPTYEPCGMCDGAGTAPASGEYVRESLRVSTAVWFALLAAPFDAMVNWLDDRLKEAHAVMSIEG